MARLRYMGLLVAICGLKITAPAWADELETQWTPVPLSSEDKLLVPGVRFGPLEFKGAYGLISTHSNFGGLSAAGWTADGQFLAISDEGHLVTLPLSEKNLTKIKTLKGTIGHLLDGRGQPLQGDMADAEGMVVDGDKLLVSFERRHRWVWYDRKTLKPLAQVPLPVAITDQLGDNAGIETLMELRPGTFLGFSEDARNERGNLKGWIVDTNRLLIQLLMYKRSGGDFFLSGIARTPDGEALILERSHSGRNDWRIVQAHAADIQGGKTLQGKLLVEVKSGSGSRFVEDIALRPLNEREVQVILVSDNNYASTPTMLVEWIYHIEKPEKPGKPEKQDSPSKENSPSKEQNSPSRE